MTTNKAIALWALRTPARWTVAALAAAVLLRSGLPVEATTAADPLQMYQDMVAYVFGTRAVLIGSIVCLAAGLGVLAVRSGRISDYAYRMTCLVIGISILVFVMSAMSQPWDGSCASTQATCQGH